jgi:hypothetical protein
MTQIEKEIKDHRELMKKEVEKMMGHEVKEPKNVKTNSGGPR